MVILFLYTFIALILLLILRIVIVVRTIQKNRRHAISASSSTESFTPIGVLKQKPTGTTSASTNQPPLRTLIVLGSGGHTSEILYMTQYLNHPYDTRSNNDTTSGGRQNVVAFDPIHYCKASTDSTSQDRLYHCQMKDDDDDDDRKNPTRTTTTSTGTGTGSTKTKQIEIYNIPRSREVGQSYISSIYTTLVAILYSMKLVYTLRPNIILCNGPGTCIPICIITFLYRILNILPNHQTYIIFIESFCRVQTLSLSGKILYSSLFPFRGLPVLFAADLFIVHWKELHEKYPNSILTNTYI